MKKNFTILLILVAILIGGLFIFSFKNTNSNVISKNNICKKIKATQAIENVKNIDEVKKYLANNSSTVAPHMLDNQERALNNGYWTIEVRPRGSIKVQMSYSVDVCNGSVKKLAL